MMYPSVGPTSGDMEAQMQYMYNGYQHPAAFTNNNGGRRTCDDGLPPPANSTPRLGMSFIPERSNSGSSGHNGYVAHTEESGTAQMLHTGRNTLQHSQLPHFFPCPSGWPA